MRKRIFALLLTGLVLFSFTACKEDKVDSHFGDISSNKYSSASIGLDAEFDEDWVLYTENEILETNGYTADSEIVEEDIKVGDSLTELLAYDIDSMDSVIVYSEKLEADADIDIEAIAEENKLQQEEYLGSSDYTNIETEIASENILGEERTCLNISASLDDENVYISYVYAHENNYLITFVLTSDSDAGVDNILSKFELN